LKLENRIFNVRNNGTEQQKESLNQDVASELDVLKERADEYFEKDEYDKVIATLTEALKIAPDDAALYYTRGSVHDTKGCYIYPGSDGNDDITKLEFALAIEDYSMVIKIDPNDAGAFVRRGTNYQYLKDYQKAFADYSKAIVINPDCDSAYNSRGRLYEKQNKIQDAINDLSKAISLNKNCPTLYYIDRGKVYMRQGDLNYAAADFREAIKRCYAPYSELNRIAHLCKDIGEYQLAIDAWSKCIKVCNDFKEFYVERANAYQLQGNWEAALADYTRSL
jgi:tetratricopeptide (TPR) repeat protein